MAEEEFERVGSGITARRRRKNKSVAPTVDAFRALAAHLRGWNTTPATPWEKHRPQIDACRERLHEIMRGAPEPYLSDDWFDWQETNMRERQDEAWYLDNILRQANCVDHHVKQGAIGWAIHEAMLLSELLTELRVKQCWELPAMWGEQRLKDAKEAAADRRKMSDEERREIVEQIAAERGLGVRDAIRTAAVRRPDGGKESSYRTAYYKKVSKPVD
ncbi:hypothetical protein [Stakelama pacifica]|nr:hypothetical protein [Stakelama pacifica]